MIRQTSRSWHIRFFAESVISGTVLLFTHVSFSLSKSGEPSEYSNVSLVNLVRIDPENPKFAYDTPIPLKNCCSLAICLIVSHYFAIWSRNVGLIFVQREEKLNRDASIGERRGE